VIVKYTNVMAKVVEATAEEKDWLDTYLAFPDDRLKYIKGYRGDGKARMFNRTNGMFMAGFIPLIVQAAPMDGVELEVHDEREVPCGADPTADLSWLRDYQAESVGAGLYHTRGIIQIPTAGGKTEVLIGIAKSLPTRWLFLTHRQQLMEQAAQRYELRTGLKAGRIGGGTWDEQDFTCATMQTIYNAVKGGQVSLEQWKGVIVDECHVAAAESVLTVLGSLRHAYYRFGFSGTPLVRGDKRSILAVGALGPVIHRIKYETLAQAGVLAKPQIKVYHCEQSSDKKTYPGVYRDAVVKSKKRNELVVKATVAAPKPAMVFVKTIQHGKALTKLLEKQGLNTQFSWGSDSTEARSNAVKALERGSLDVLVASVVYQEGVDIPSLRSVIIAAGGKSSIAAIQRIGRGMRIDKDKTEFTVVDIADKGNGFLERHSKARVKAYKTEGYTVEEVP
jgi:superfamily II DNA or RNA helicase